MEDENWNPFLNVREAEDFLRLKKRTLDNMRWMGTGPNFRNHGGRVYYHIDELKDWSLETRAKSTSQY
ncbi:MAG: helix-turn-helix domain-containing protein [Rhizobiales bacterium]|nr:helix-turn-helix domain-containing protein [Hyphomicrobiales bacterium]